MLTAGSAPACETRWMSAAENVKCSPAATIRERGAPPSVRRSSRTCPATTATAPADRSWSWKPVS